MARPIRIRVAGGWYHVMARGHDRGLLFGNDSDRKHFLELLAAMRERYRVRVVAYCLMPNHFHLLLITPEANLSAAMQWLGGSYGIWHNRRHRRLGHLFAGRFKAVLVENAAWGLEVSVYIHLNPVATEMMGLNKRTRAAQHTGLAAPPTAEELTRRLREVRQYRWSSYRAYAGYAAMPDWLDADMLWRNVGTGELAQRSAYRTLVEDRIRQGEDEPLLGKIRWGLVLGGERFARQVRRRIRVHRESEGQRTLSRRWDFEEIVKKVERFKQESWDDFHDRYGDSGRDLTLWAGRRYGRLTLAELGRAAGGLDYSAVAMAIRRLDVKARRDKPLRSAMQRLKTECAK